jgi:hypothetical protein
MSFIRHSSRESSQARQPLSDTAFIFTLAIWYAFPAALMLDVFQSSLNVQIWGIIAFTIYPVCMTLVARIMKAFTKDWPSKFQSQHQKIPTLRYAVIGGAALQGHLWYLATISGFFNEYTLSLAAEEMESDKASKLVLRFLQVDYAITFVAMLLLAWHELVRHKILPAWRGLGGMVVGWILVGPGATLAVAWYLRSQFTMRPRTCKLDPKIN